MNNTVNYQEIKKALNSVIDLDDKSTQINIHLQFDYAAITQRLKGKTDSKYFEGCDAKDVYCALNTTFVLFDSTDIQIKITPGKPVEITSKGLLNKRS
jgi:hypothetical protein